MREASRLPARVSKWLSTWAFGAVAVLSLLAVELDHRWVVATLEETVVAVDNLTRAKLAVTDAVLAWEGAEAGDPTWSRGTDVARLDEAVGALEDLLAGRSALLSFGGRPLAGDPVLDSLVARYRALVAEVRSDAAGSGLARGAVPRRLRVAALAGAATDVERAVYSSVRGRLAETRRRHSALLLAWGAFLALTGVVLAGLRAARQRAERQRAAAESRYATLERLATVGIFRVDVAGSIHEATPWWVHLVGRTERDCTGLEWWEILPEEERPAARELWQARVTAGEEFAQEIKLVDGEGRRRSLLGRWAPSHDEGGGRGGWVGAFVDVTEQRSVEAQVHQLQKLEAVGRLTGSVVHDFNNLLSVILTNSHLLLTDPAGLDDDAREMIGDIERAGRSGQDLVKRLMGFSRRSPLTLLPLDLAATVAESATLARKLLSIGVELDLRLPEPGPVVNADPRAVEQILLNLVSNARDAMPDGGRILVEVDAFDADVTFAAERPWLEQGRWGRITVTDAGVGMDEATLEQIFDPFFTTKREGKGTGLGLSTVHGLMRQHGGHVLVYSEPGVGTTFRLYFPASAASVAPSPSEASRTRGGPTPQGSLSILLVEDDQALRRTAARVLVRMGYRVQEAEGGEQALRLLAAGDTSVDLIISDLTMAGMDGVQFFRRLRERGDQRPFIFTSGRPERELRESGALPAGAAFLAKPWAVKELADAIRGLGLRAG